MSDNDYDEFINEYKDILPNCDQYPKQFEFLVKSFLYRKMTAKNDDKNGIRISN